MATFSGLTSQSPALQSPGMRSPLICIGYFGLPFQKRDNIVYKISKLTSNAVLNSTKNPNLQVQYFHRRCSGRKNILNATRNYQLSDKDDFKTQPYWLNTMREATGTIRSLFEFLIAQPSQLKYIEWPSFQNTLKTATLTLVIVAFLIVALSSVDSALSYLLALFLRRKA